MSRSADDITVSEELPCVRCGGQPDFDCNAYDTWWVICKDCGLEKNGLASKSEAVEWWNDRAAPGSDAVAGDAKATLWTENEFWQYVEGLTDEHVRDQMRNMLSCVGLSISSTDRGDK